MVLKIEQAGRREQEFGVGEDDEVIGSRIFKGLELLFEVLLLGIRQKL